MLTILALVRLKQEDYQEFKATTGYSTRTVTGIKTLCQKKKKKKSKANTRHRPSAAK